MRRPAIRFLLTLATAVSIMGVVPATSEAGIIPWAWDTLFGPVGSIQARHAGYCGGGDCGVYNAGYAYGPAPMFVGFRGWRGRACCGTPYASYGCGACGAYGCSSCGTGCSTGCSSCGTGCGGYDGGYIYGSGGCGPGGCGVGGCASGQCNVNYGGGPSPTGAASPVTPAPLPGQGAAGQGAAGQGAAGQGAAGQGAAQGYDHGAGPGVPGAAADDGFVPATGRPKSPAPPTGDPTKDDYKPPIVNPTEGGAGPTDASATEPGGTNTVTPATPGPTVPKKKSPLAEDDEKGGAIGPRLELDQKITWRQSFVRTRQVQSVIRVSASAHRYGMFPKTAWRTEVETELAKK